MNFKPTRRTMLSLATSAAAAPLAPAHTQDKDRLAWFRQARYGMFIHWGLYAIPGRGEWVQYHEGIPRAEYEKLVPQFNPVKFDAKQWVGLAREAGMKYLVVTTKHHDGFAMYDSKLTDYTIVRATPFKRDPIKELSEECRKQGVRFCIYYSVKDWHHPEYPTLYTFRSKKHPDGFHGDPNPRANYLKYLDYMQGQLRELLTNYGPVGTIFFDWYGDAFEDPEERRRGLEIVDMIHKLQPECLINNRFGGLGADYGTPEQMIPEGQLAQPFEVCQTLNGTWGFSRTDRNWKSVPTVVEQLCDTVSKGGNYLLNVGPTPEGVIPEESAAILRKAGEWLRRNEEAVYGAGPGPDMRWQPDIKMVTTKPGKYYLHVFAWPSDRRIFYWDFRHKLNKAYLLTDPERRPLKVDVLRRSLTVHVPAQSPDPVNSIVVLDWS